MSSGLIKIPLFTPSDGNGVPVEPLSSRERFLRACRCQPVDHPPVWLMRQAGRVLPEYRVLKEKYTFAELIDTPELAAEVTLQPIRRFGFDAAILFSDILVVPEAMGQSFQFRETGGVQMEFDIRSEADLARLDETGAAERLGHVGQALRLIKAELSGERALIGFAGSPWTLANFMMEGGSSKEFTRAQQLFDREPELFNRLCEKLTKCVTEFLLMQIEAGADVVQIFDSLGGLLPSTSFAAASGRWLGQIVKALHGRVPVIVFSKGAHHSLDILAGLGADVLGFDWTVSLGELAQRLPDKIGIQGNLDPSLLEGTPAVVGRETRRILTELRHRSGHIFNLGHGVPPGAKLDCVQTLVDTVRTSHERA